MYVHFDSDRVQRACACAVVCIPMEITLEYDVHHAIY